MLDHPGLGWSNYYFKELMKLPFLLKAKLDSESIDVWNNVLLTTRGTTNDKTVEQSLWRRTQTERNAAVSGWKEESDKGRKIVYYKHKYDMIEVKGKKHLALMSTYVYIALTLKTKDLIAYKKMCEDNVVKGKWKSIENNKYTNGDLRLTLNHYQSPANRAREFDQFPEGYETLEIEVKSKNYEMSNEQEQIWQIAKAGLRKSLKRDNPHYVKDVKEISEYLPCQIEMGCGPSFEAGVWPLHVLHEIYSINEPFTKKFIIDAENDKFVDNLIGNPNKVFRKTSDFFGRIVTSKLTDFYYILKELYEKGKVVGPILTNNFDGLHLRVGIPELFLRTYDEVDVMPELQFDPKAKSLMVIGCHADRRGIERRARERGLKIIYIDPEGWWVDDKFFDYPLESPQPSDMIFKKTAHEVFREFAKEYLGFRA
jgi:hypothetical protein